MNRRNAMKMGLFGAGATAAGLALPLGESASTADWISTSARPGRFQRQLPVPQPITPQMLTDDYGDFLHYDITERAGFAQILDTNAPKTPILGYAAGNGAPTVPGPLIKVDVNTRVRLRVKNALPTKHPTFGFEGGETSVHLHGSASLPQYDGYADDLTPPGYYKDYWYANAQGMRTLWYHDHRAHHTAENAYSGLAAQYHIQTPWEKENLPQGRYDVPLTVTDAMFARDGKLAYMDRDHSGLFGDVILVNAVPWPWLKVERRFYRFRVLVATLSRSFTFSLVNLRTGATLPVYVVATDGGPMVPQQVTSWRHSTAERYEIMVDFAGCRLGDVVEMRNSSNRNNVNYLHTGKVMQFRVAANATESRWNTVVTPPASELSPLMDKTADDSMRRRDIDLKHDDVTNEFSLNEMTWEDIRDANWNIFTDDGHGHPKVGDYEVWRIENDSGGWFHPMHIHLVDFKILSRSGGAGKVQPWERGPKDVVYVGEGERIELLVHYVMPKPYYPDGRSTGLAGATGYLGGRYMIHCHNLPHEDHDMMGQFLVAASDGTVDLSTDHPNHPVEAAPAQKA